MEDLNTLVAVSPIDGRYHSQTQHLSSFFSEFGLIKYRLKIEIKYLLFLIKLNIDSKFDTLTDAQKSEILNIYTNFSETDAQRIKVLEKECNHDVKALEYFIKDKLISMNCAFLVPFIHFGLTSQDINNCAITSSLKDFIYKIYIPHLLNIITIINIKSKQWKLIRMLAHTHGQPAVPTTLGKELKVYSYRLQKQLELLKDIKYYGKFGGAVGNLNAHYFAFPKRNWKNDLDRFLHSDLGLFREKFTTQIDNYENLAVLFDCLRRINSILIDFDKDLWHYISLNYLQQSININEVGSSTMPQKVNPINFENSEGNLLLSNSLLDFMSNKLPVSRLQRDLVDSTVLRNIGTIFGHIEIGFQSFEIGFSKIYPNYEAISVDLNKDMSILTEGIQVELRKQGIQNAYEINKKLARTNTKLSKPQLIEFIQNLDCIDQECKDKLSNISPVNYIGNAASFVN